MRIECPYCWQHYEIEPSEENEDFVCIYCEQMFNGQDALKLSDSRETLKSRILYVIAFVALILSIGNVGLWFFTQKSIRENEYKAFPIEKLQVSDNGVMKTFDVQRKGLFDNEIIIDRVSDELVTTARISEETVRDTDKLTEDLKKSIAQLENDVALFDTSRLESIEKSLSNIEKKYDSIYNLNKDVLPKTEIHLEALTNGLASLRQEIAPLKTLAQRVSDLEFKIRQLEKQNNQQVDNNQ